MRLKTEADFNEAFYLLGCYQQDVLKTGKFDYPGTLTMPKTADKPLEAEPAIKLEDSPSIATTPLAEQTTGNEQKIDNTEKENEPQPSEKTIIIEHEVKTVNKPDGSIETIEKTKTTEEKKPMSELEKQRLLLLSQQEEERRLFYLCIHEVEMTGQLDKLPEVVRPHFEKRKNASFS